MDLCRVVVHNDIHAKTNFNSKKSKFFLTLEEKHHLYSFFFFFLQLDIFRHEVKQNYPTDPDIDLADDFRPIQPLNHRNIYTSNINGRSDPQQVSSPDPLNSATVTRFSMFHVTLLSIIAFVIL